MLNRRFQARCDEEVESDLVRPRAVGRRSAKGEFGWVLVAAVVEELIGLLCVGDGFGFW